MDLKSPSVLVTAWLLVPALVALASVGLGLGVQALSGWRVGALLAPVGFATGIFLGTLLLKVGVSGVAVVITLALLSLAGLGVGIWDLRRRPADDEAKRELRWAAAAALVAFVIGMAPLVGGGRSAVLGYVVNNDPAIHISAVEIVRDHGADLPDFDIATSFNEAATLPGGDYPIGSYVWPLFSAELAAMDVFHVWAPLNAVALAMLALVLFAGLRRFGATPVAAAVGGAIASCGYLTFSFLAQGSAKELVTAVTVYAAVVLAAAAIRDGPAIARLVVVGLPAGAALAAFGAAVGTWLAPAGIALVAVLASGLRRAKITRRRALIGLGTLALAVAIAVPAIGEAIDYVESADSTFTDENRAGNLVGPVPWRSALGVWLEPDYRLFPPTHEALSLIGAYLAAAAGVIGLAAALRRRQLAVPLALAGGAVGAIVISSRYSIYLDAKSYMMLAPAFGLAAAAGVCALLASRGARRIAGAVAGATLAIGVLASDALVYGGVWLTPGQKLEELASIADRFDGQGPVLINEREEYAYYFLRESDPIEPWSGWGPSDLRSGFRPPIPHVPDFDDYRFAYIATFELLLERKRPGGSLPPSGFAPVHETPHYRIWQRSGPLPAMHVALGRNRLENAEPLDCRRANVRHVLSRSRRLGRPVLAADGGTPPRRVIDPVVNWFDYDPGRAPVPDGMLYRREGGAFARVGLPAGTYDAWIQGGFGPGVRLVVDRRPRGDAFGLLDLPSAWHHLGRVRWEGGDADVALIALDKPWWQAGSTRYDTTGQVVFEASTPAPRVTTVAPERARRLCGRTLDWIELAAG